MTIKSLEQHIEDLQHEIKQQSHLLENYVAQKDWVKAGSQQQYIQGLNYALHLAMARYSVIAGESNKRNDTTNS